MSEEPEIINETRMYFEGYIYTRARLPIDRTTYWDCVRVRDKECRARGRTVRAPNGQIVLVQGPEQSLHMHAPNREEVEAEKLQYRLKRIADEDENTPLDDILRQELHGVRSGILSQLPKRESLKQSMRRVRKMKENYQN